MVTQLPRELLQGTALVAKMALEERHDTAHLVIVLSRTAEDSIVPAALVVHDFHVLSSPPQCRLEVARHPHGGKWSSAIGRTVCRAVHHQDRRRDVRNT